MRRTGHFFAAAAALLIGAGACAQAPEFAPVYAEYPEGPTTVGQDVYWSEMGSDQVRRWRGGEVATVWSEPGCGPTAVETAGDGGFWILCHLADKVVRVDVDFESLFEVTDDGAGGRMESPNDGSPDGAGGVFVSSSGRFDLRAPARGRIIHIDAEGGAEIIWTGLRYANGAAFDSDASVLFVSEHLARRVWRAEIGADGRPASPEVFYELDPLTGAADEYRLAGPDGLLIESDGGLIVAEYGAGLLHRIDASGVEIARASAPAAFVTNMTRAPWDEGVLIVTASHVNNRLPMDGVVAPLEADAFSAVGLQEETP